MFRALRDGSVEGAQETRQSRVGATLSRDSPRQRCGRPQRQLARHRERREDLVDGGRTRPHHLHRSAHEITGRTSPLSHDAHNIFHRPSLERHDERSGNCPATHLGMNRSPGTNINVPQLGEVTRRSLAQGAHQQIDRVRDNIYQLKIGTRTAAGPEREVALDVHDRSHHVDQPAEPGHRLLEQQLMTGTHQHPALRRGGQQLFQLGSVFGHRLLDIHMASPVDGCHGDFAMRTHGSANVDHVGPGAGDQLVE